MARTIFAIALSYLSGSVLYANIFGDLFKVRDKYALTPDRNPGVANAYACGGFWCGTLTLVFELLKGFLPVFFLTRLPGLRAWGQPIILAAPLVGHIFPIFYDFHGGKGIAVTFGCLIGLFPYTRPFAILAAAFIFFSVIVVVTPHYYRTIVAYITAALAMWLTHIRFAVLGAFLFMAALGCLRMYMAHEEKEKLEVKLLWMR